MAAEMSDLWTRKMKTYFSRIDFDKDGTITKADFEGMGERFNKVEKLQGKAADLMKEKLVQIWDKYISHVGDDAAAGLNEASFLKAMAKIVNDPAQKATLAGPLPLFFSAVDANDDGFIDSGEYGLFFEIFGLNKDMAPASFQAIDENNDGLLSADEFVAAGTNFFTSNEPKCPTKLFWGPLL